MTWVDALVVLILSLSALIAFLRGLVREVLGLGAWVGAAYLATVMFNTFQPQVRGLIGNPEIADPVAFGLLFLFGLIAFSVLAGLIARMVRGSALSSLDRTVGLVFGIVRGGLLISAAYIGAGMLFAVQLWPDSILQSRSLPYIYQGAVWIADQLPARFTPKVSAPPAVANTTDQLLQSPPQGFARDGRVPPATVDTPADGQGGQEGH